MSEIENMSESDYNNHLLKPLIDIAKVLRFAYAGGLETVTILPEEAYALSVSIADWIECCAKASKMGLISEPHQCKDFSELVLKLADANTNGTNLELSKDDTSVLFEHIVWLSQGAAMYRVVNIFWEETDKGGDVQ